VHGVIVFAALAQQQIVVFPVTAVDLNELGDVENLEKLLGFGGGDSDARSPVGICFALHFIGKLHRLVGNCQIDVTVAHLDLRGVLASIFHPGDHIISDQVAFCTNQHGVGVRIGFPGHEVIAVFQLLEPIPLRAAHEAQFHLVVFGARHHQFAFDLLLVIGLAVSII